jgi:site-specific recombinase XerD
VSALAVVEDSGPTRHPGWAPLAERAPQLVATAWRYLDQIGLSLRPATVAAADIALRGLAQHLTAERLDCFAAVERRHIESYKQWLATGGTRDRRPPARNTIRQRLGLVRSFFDRIIEWDWADAPTRTPMFAIDVPVADDPLPRFLDDAQAARLLAAAGHASCRRRPEVLRYPATAGAPSAAPAIAATPAPAAARTAPGACRSP